ARIAHRALQPHGQLCGRVLRLAAAAGTAACYAVWQPNRGHRCLPAGGVGLKMEGQDTDFSYVLRAMSDNLRVSRAQLSRESGLSLTTLRRWAGGYALPGPENFNRLVIALSDYASSEMLNALTIAHEKTWKD